MPGGELISVVRRVESLEAKVNDPSHAGDIVTVESLNRVDHVVVSVLPLVVLLNHHGLAYYRFTSEYRVKLRVLLYYFELIWGRYSGAFWAAS